MLLVFNKTDPDCRVVEGVGRWLVGIAGSNFATWAEMIVSFEYCVLYRYRPLTSRSLVQGSPNVCVCVIRWNNNSLHVQ